MAGLVQEGELRRSYATDAVRRRIHQRTFRERVLRAYRRRCALCRLHHGAFGALLLGIRPDLKVEVRQDVLDEEDGPVLRHGLQGIHGQRIHVPSRLEEHPDPARLEQRYERFCAAG